MGERLATEEADELKTAPHYFKKEERSEETRRIAVQKKEEMRRLLEVEDDDGPPKFPVVKASMFRCDPRGEYQCPDPMIFSPELKTKGRVSLEEDDISEFSTTSSLDYEPREYHLRRLSGKMKQTPKLLKESSETKVCCVFRIPQSLADKKVKAYFPLIVSVGPYHNGENQLKAMEEHKWRYLHALVSRVEPHGVNLDTLFDVVLSMEDEIRDCYSEQIMFEKHKLAALMLLDGCFVVELVCRATKVVKCEENDPILGIPWLLPYVLRDLLRLENQIPFSLIHKIYDSVKCGLGSGGEAAGEEDVPSVVTKLALKFFNQAMERDEKVMKEYWKWKRAVHLLDLFCLSFMPKEDQSHHQERCNCHCLSIGWREGGLKSVVQTSEGFYSAMKLHQAGIRIEIRKETESFLDVKFVNGVLQVPRFSIDDFMASVFLNAIAFEQSYKHRIDYFTGYANFMGHLINTPADAGFLCDRGIIQNSLGNHDELAQFFNAVRKDVVIDSDNGYLNHVLQGIEKYRGTKRAKVHASLAELWDKYFASPWAGTSFLAAFTTILLTAIQTHFTIHPKK